MVVILGAIMLFAGGASATASPVTKLLPITSFRQIVADSAHGHLFFSEGSRDYNTTGGTGAILVTDLSGNTVTTITGLTGVKDMALSPDGSTLYAAVAGSDEIVAISTTTLAVTATYSTGSYPSYSLAFEDGLLWVSYGPAHPTVSGVASIGYIDPTASNPRLVPGVLNNSWLYPPFIATDPGNASAASTTGTVVAVAPPNETPVSAASFQISGGTVTSSASANLTTSDDAWHGLSFLPGGSQFLLDDAAYESSDLGPGTAGYTYGGGGDSATTVAPSGAVAVGYGTGSATDAGVATYPAGSTTNTPTNTYQHLGDPYSYIAGAAWSADSSELFSVITQDNSSGNITGYTLQTLYPPTPWAPPQPLSLSVSAGAVGYKGTVKISAGIGVTNDSTSSHRVDIYETPAGGQQKLLTTLTIGSGGTTTFTSPQLTTTTSFTASVSGDSDFSAATTPAKKVSVAASVQESISGYYGSTNIGGYTYRDYHRTANFRDVATVAPAKPGECVKFEFQHWNGNAWVSAGATGCGDLNSSSSFTYNRSISGYQVGGHYRARVDFVPGSSDTANLAADSGWILFIVQK